MNKLVHIYTDGSSRGNPGPGGYGVVMKLSGTNYQKEFSEGYRLTTNNRMELLAVIVGLEQLKKENTHVLVVSDSKYVIDAVDKKWVHNWVAKNFKDKKNKDLWLRFLKVYNQHQVSFQWVKGHNNHPENERCDFLATQAAMQKNLLVDEGFENLSTDDRLKF